MLSSLEAKNFQSWKSVYIDFHPGVNIFVGSSDVGKTALLRQLRLVISNKPFGDSYRSNWGGDTSVIIGADGKKVSRIKTDTVNEYIIDSPDKDPLVLTGFGQSVPDEVSEVLNFGDINFQSQMSAPFLLSESAGEVARVLNKIANLDKIDVATSFIKSEGLEAKRKHKDKEAKQKKAIEELKALDFLTDFEEAIVSIEEIERWLIIKRNEKAKLQHLHENIIEVTQLINSTRPLLAAEETVKKAEQLQNEITKQTSQIAALQEILYDWENIHKELLETSQLLVAEKDVKELQKQLEEFQIKETEAKNLRDLVADIEDTLCDIETAESNISQFEEEFNCLMPDICPLCGMEGEHEHK